MVWLRCVRAGKETAVCYRYSVSLGLWPSYRFPLRFNILQSWTVRFSFLRDICIQEHLIAMETKQRVSKWKAVCVHCPVLQFILKCMRSPEVSFAGFWVCLFFSYLCTAAFKPNQSEVKNKFLSIVVAPFLSVPWQCKRSYPREQIGNSKHARARWWLKYRRWDVNACVCGQ